MSGVGGGAEGQNAKEPNDTLFIAKLRDESFITRWGRVHLGGRIFFFFAIYKRVGSEINNPWSRGRGGHILF